MVNEFIVGKEAGSYEAFIKRGCCSSSGIDYFNDYQYILQYA